MLKSTLYLMKQYGLLAKESYSVKGRTGNYIVEILDNGKMTCTCPAGMREDCRHRRIIRNMLNGEKYEH